MSKKFLSSFGKKIIIISLISGSAISAGLAWGYYLFLNNENNGFLRKEKKSVEKIEYIYSVAKQIYGDNSPVFYQATPKNEGNYWLNEDEVEMLLKKIRSKLGYGPEFGKLRSITIGDENMTGEDANGVYLPALNKIYINLENFKKIIDNLRGRYIENVYYDSELLSKIKVNLIFEIIYHEYGHHIGFSYLTNEYDPQTRDKSIFVNGYDKNNKLKRTESNWNKNFTTEFKKLLNYSGWKGKKYNNKTQTFQERKYKSIGSIYSQQDLFNHANGKKEYSYPEMDKDDEISYLFAGDSKFIDAIPLEIQKENLPYYYSMDELFTRKYQQLNQIYEPVAKTPTFLKGYFGYNFSGYNTFDYNSVYQRWKISTFSDILSNTLLYQNGFGKFNKVKQELENYNNHRKDYNFYDSTISNRFLYDAPFNNDNYTYINEENGEAYCLEDVHEELYNLMDRFLGHELGADISIVWPKNEIKVSDDDYKQIRWYEKNIEEANSLFKFGGYLKTNNYVSVGYKDNNNKYNELSKITVKDFTYKYKDWLGATEHVELDPNKENYFYTTNQFVDKTKLLNKKLFFKKKNNLGEFSYEPLSSVRYDQSTGNNSTWYSNFSDIFNIEQKYSFVYDTNKKGVLFKEIP